MRKLSIKRLERDEELREFLYHVKGIAEASENIADLAKSLNDAHGRDADAFADTTSELEVQALHHLGYHVKSLRTPLRRLQREAYARLEESGKTASTRPRKRAAKATAEKPARPRRVTAAASRLKK